MEFFFFFDNPIEDYKKNYMKSQLVKEMIIQLVIC